jgi:ketosteroid isomerase-like protein
MAETNDLRARVERLEQELSGFRDRQQILDVLQRYPRALDRHDSDVLASVFHDDARLHYPSHLFTTGPTDFVPWANALHEGQWISHVHYAVPNSIEIDGDVAHTQMYVLFTLRRKDGEGVDIGGGRYVDRLERRNGEWKIAAREMIVEWRGRLETSYDEEDGPPGTWDRSDVFYSRPLEVPAR